MTAINPAVNPVANSALVNQPVPEVEGTLWPGAIGPTEHNIGGWEDHSAEQPGLPPRPSPATPPDHNAFLGDAGWEDNGSGGIDPSGLSYMQHDVQTDVWDSSAGHPFKGSGAIGPLHAIGTGSDPKFFEIPADEGSPRNLTPLNQSYAPAWSWDGETGQRDNEPTPRVARDTVINVNGSGYDTSPRFTEVELNPVYNNLAVVGQPSVNAETPYAVAGALSDRAAYADNQSTVYNAPPDPAVSQLPGAAGLGSEGIDGVL